MPKINTPYSKKIRQTARPGPNTTPESAKLRGSPGARVTVPSAAAFSPQDQAFDETGQRKAKDLTVAEQSPGPGRQFSPQDQAMIDTQGNKGSEGPADEGGFKGQGRNRYHAQVAQVEKLKADLSSMFLEYGNTGLLRFGQYVYEEWHKDLHGKKAAIIYREIRDNDPIVGAILTYVDLLIRQMPWTVEASEADVDGEQKAYVEGCMNDMEHTWKEFISEALSLIPFGYHVAEEVYKYRRGEEHEDPRFFSEFDDGKIGWRKFSTRSQETQDGWLFDENTNDTIGMYQQPPYGGRVLIPLNKCIHLKYRSERENPEGRSAFRSLYTAYMSAKVLRWIEGVGYERDVGGMPVFEVPPTMLSADADDDDAAIVTTLFKIVQQIKRDERMGAVIPGEFNTDGERTGYKLWFAQSQTGGSAIHQAIVRYEQREAMVLMGEFILLGTNEHGSYSMHDDKTNHFAMALDAITDIIEGFLNRRTIPRLMRFNGVPRELWPKVKHGDIKKRSLGDLANYLNMMFNMGIQITPEDEDYIRKQGDLPKRAGQEGL